MNMPQRKILLFIEPCPSSYSLLLKAREKRHTSFVIVSEASVRNLPSEIHKTCSSFFQINTKDSQAVLDLIIKIRKKFIIEGVIPGNNSFAPLAGDIAISLKKPGMSSKALACIPQKEILFRDCCER